MMQQHEIDELRYLVSGGRVGFKPDTAQRVMLHILDLEQKIKRMEAQLSEYRDASTALNNAYLAIRELVGAWATPYAPTLADVRELTEERIRDLIAERDRLRREASCEPISARERQRRDFAYGNAHIDNPSVTREMVDEAAERLANKPSPGVLTGDTDV